MLVRVVDGGWPLYFCCTVGTVVAGIGILRARKRGLERIRDLERQNALELERLRIAQDMHDGLGADLTRLAMLAELARRESGSEGAQCRLEQVAGIARGLVDHISELVWATNPRHNTLDALAAYLHQYTSELLEPRGLISRFEIPNPLPPIAISGELRRHLLLATKEVLNNTLKHAGASEVRFRMTFHETRLEILVADNGCGFSPSWLRPTAEAQGRRAGYGRGNGLWNLRERLSAVGGFVQLESAPGRGTRVRLGTPLAPSLRTSVPCRVRSEIGPRRGWLTADPDPRAPSRPGAP